MRIWRVNQVDLISRILLYYICYFGSAPSSKSSHAALRLDTSATVLSAWLNQTARLQAERVVILLFLVAFLDSIGRFLYVGYNEQYIYGPFCHLLSGSHRPGLREGRDVSSHSA